MTYLKCDHNWDNTDKPCPHCEYQSQIKTRWDGVMEVSARASYKHLNETGELDKIKKIVRRPLYKVDSKGLIELNINEFNRRKFWRD
jgi:hypothetical protein